MIHMRAEARSATATGRALPVALLAKLTPEPCIALFVDRFGAVAKIRPKAFGCVTLWQLKQLGSGRLERCSTPNPGCPVAGRAHDLHAVRTLLKRDVELTRMFAFAVGGGPRRCR